MEAVAAKIIKQFYVITQPFTGNTFTLLGNRDLFTEDKNKRDAAERRMKKKAAQEAKSQAKSNKANSKRAVQELAEFVQSDVPLPMTTKNNPQTSQAILKTQIRDQILPLNYILNLLGLRMLVQLRLLRKGLILVALEWRILILFLNSLFHLLDRYYFIHSSFLFSSIYP